jgi:single-strand DNA-binding protein
MNETQVTVVGNVVTAISKRRLDDGTVVANFRVGNNERRYDRSTDRWVPGERLYVQVQCWRRLAENAAASLAMGDPVVVTGRLFTRNYAHDGQRRSVVTLDAHTVAADLSRCTASIVRSRSEATAAPAVADAAAPTAERPPDGDVGRVPRAGSMGGAASEPGARDSRLVAVAPAGEG